MPSADYLLFLQFNQRSAGTPQTTAQPEMVTHSDVVNVPMPGPSPTDKGQPTALPDSAPGVTPLFGLADLPNNCHRRLPQTFDPGKAYLRFSHWQRDQCRFF